jgi:hypothetical protein
MPRPRVALALRLTFASVLATGGAGIVGASASKAASSRRAASVSAPTSIECRAQRHR